MDIQPTGDGKVRTGVCEISGRTWQHEGRGPVGRLHPDLRGAWYARDSAVRAAKGNARVKQRKANYVKEANDAAMMWADFKPWPIDGRIWVSTCGLVWDSERGRFPKIKTDQKGYKVFGNGFKKHFVHSAVLQTYAGERPTGAITRHINGKKDDNRLANLEWATRSQNSLDVKWHGKAKHIKLYPSDILEVRKAFEAGETKMGIARRYNVDASTIYKVLIGKTHADVV